jgi:hypothetical protein
MCLHACLITSSVIHMLKTNVQHTRTHAHKILSIFNTKHTHACMHSTYMHAYIHSTHIACIHLQAPPAVFFLQCNFRPYNCDQKRHTHDPEPETCVVMHVSMYICIYMFMYVCMYIYTYIVLDFSLCDMHTILLHQKAGLWLHYNHEFIHTYIHTQRCVTLCRFFSVWHAYDIAPSESRPLISQKSWVYTYIHTYTKMRYPF